jgi:hypothetical protein
VKFCVFCVFLRLLKEGEVGGEKDEHRTLNFQHRTSNEKWFWRRGLLRFLRIFAAIKRGGGRGRLERFLAAMKYESLFYQKNNLPDPDCYRDISDYFPPLPGGRRRSD